MMGKGLLPIFKVADQTQVELHIIKVKTLDVCIDPFANQVTFEDKYNTLF